MHADQNRTQGLDNPPLAINQNLCHVHIYQATSLGRLTRQGIDIHFEICELKIISAYVVCRNIGILYICCGKCWEVWKVLVGVERLLCTYACATLQIVSQITVDTDGTSHLAATLPQEIPGNVPWFMTDSIAVLEDGRSSTACREVVVNVMALKLKCSSSRQCRETTHDDHEQNWLSFDCEHEPWQCHNRSKTFC